jgi:formylglycine-generating enzyme required for sulfatase activity
MKIFNISNDSSKKRLVPIIKIILTVSGLCLTGYLFYSVFIKSDNKYKTLKEIDIVSEIEMVKIPEGEFIMGSNMGHKNEIPERRVYLDSYCISKYEITNRQYCVFLNEKGNHIEGEAVWFDIEGRFSRIDYKNGKFTPKPTYSDHPVVEVTWYGARAFCRWLSEITESYWHLPTEAQWEKAARGPDGRVYSWGDDSPDCAYANFYSCVGDTKQVGSYTAGISLYGLYDMAGNVWEWCDDWYEENYYSHAPYKNPKGTDFATYKVVRGGCWYGNIDSIRCAYRTEFCPVGGYSSVGFRIVKE